jgi:hypothetical protein
MGLNGRMLNVSSNKGWKGCERVDWRQVAEDRIKSRALVNTIMKIPKVVSFLEYKTMGKIQKHCSFNCTSSSEHFRIKLSSLSLVCSVVSFLNEEVC